MKLFFVQCAGNTPDGMLGPDLSRFVVARDIEEAMTEWSSGLVTAFFKVVNKNPDAASCLEVDAAMVAMVGGQTISVSEVKTGDMSEPHLCEWGDTYSTIIPDTIEEVTAQRAAQARAAH